MSEHVEENSKSNEELLLNPNCTLSKKISALKPDIVHKICADRVVGSLAIAIKELVENSIDAGATSIQIRIKEYGLESIEVVDNGKGVQECDFEALAQSYHTSKISEFSDLDSIATFGFRGEALSSLCRLCNGITVVTRHTSASCASKLEYDASGKLIKQSACAGLVGTKVTLTKLFSTLPVRHKVFANKCKQDFNKAVQMLHAYCIIAEGVRIHVSHQRASGKDWSVIVSTQGGTLIENLSIVAGHKTVSNVLPLHNKNETNDVDSNKSYFKLCGYISSCGHGCGHSTPEKQYYFINGRPCDLPKANRLINQLYRQLNKHQFPVIVLNVITSSKKSVDVNLAPDKRSIVMKSEAVLLDLIKDTLMLLYQNIPNTIPLNTNNPMTLNNSTIVTNSPSNVRSLPNLFRLSSQDLTEEREKLEMNEINELNSIEDNTIDDVNLNKTLEQKSESPIFNTCNSSKLMAAHNRTNCNSQQIRPFQSLKVIPENVKNVKGSPISSLEQFRCSHPSKFVDTPSSTKNSATKRSGDAFLQETKFRKINDFLKPILKKQAEEQDDTQNLQPITCFDHEQISNSPCTQKFTNNVLSSNSIDSHPLKNLSFETKDSYVNPGSPKDDNKGMLIVRKPELQEEESWLLFNRKEVLIEDTLKTIIMNTPKTSTHPVKKQTQSSRFTVSIDLAGSKEAELELQREITKDMFEKMTIIGQFNKAFILAKLDEDIFLIDQHAADEKFNFEQLGKNATRQSQRLIIPQILDLNPKHEFILMEYQDKFRQNGFEFIINEEEAASKKIKLTSVPTYLHATFKLDDIIDLIHQLEEFPNEVPQPSRIRTMLASKACRQSIMVGQALDHKAMDKLVKNLATMDNPWNCPHGRPTMRHLTSLHHASAK